MTRSTVVFRLSLAILAAGSVPATALVAQEPVVSAESRADDDALFTTEELDNLLAPIALYPDPILAELFIAATYPEQIALAHRFVEEYGSDDVDNQAWDRSVKAIARYGPVLNMLYERPNWATAVGRAYAMQSGDVMASVQSLRRMAKAQGNLVSTDQQRVYVEREYIRIVPAQPRVIYVPVYDPYVVYYRPIEYVRVVTPYWSFGVGYPIGPWLGYDCDWDTRVVYYHGWSNYGRSGWWVVSRPYFGYDPYWMGPRISVVVNLGVRHRYVNYGGFGYYNSVHRNMSWNRSRMPGRGRFDNHVSKQPAPDRYGIPSRRDSYVGRPSKENVVPVVPRAGGSRPSGGTAGTTAGTGSRSKPGRGNAGSGGSAGRGNNGNGGDRANGGGRSNGGNSGIREDRVAPVRIGGNRRPLYPGSEDISPDRARGSAPERREASTDNGSWNPRGEAKREVARGRDMDPVRTPRASGERIAPNRGTTNESRPTPRYETRSAPRTETRSAPRSYEAPRSAPRTYDAPRSAPRVERNVEPRTTPRMSAPRASAPRESAPRASAPRASAPRGESAPRASAPRSSGSHGSSGGVPRARGKRDP